MSQYISLVSKGMPIARVINFFDDEQTFSEMKEKYKKYATFFHPDKNLESPDPSLLESCFKTISQAFKISKLFSDSQRLFR